MRAALVPTATEKITALRDALSRSELPHPEATRDLLQNFDAAVTDLSRATGVALVDLEQYEGGLSDELNRFRRLSEQDAAWLRTQVADPQISLAALAFCLELLVSHQMLTTQEVDELEGRWKKDLTKALDTTYRGWCHPLLTLTVGAHQLDHPAAQKLQNWWHKARPAWARTLRPATALAHGGEPEAAALLETSGAGGDIVLTGTYTLMRARLDGASPAEVVDGWVHNGPPGGWTAVRLETLAVTTYDPAQPLWETSRTGRGSFERAVELARDHDLSTATRRLGLRWAVLHRLYAHPETCQWASDAERAGARDTVATLQDELGEITFD